MALPELKTVDIGGTPISIRDTATTSDDNKPVIVLLHGLAGSSQTWAFQFRTLSEYFRSSHGICQVTECREGS